jgi:hypothetical protein
MVLSQGSYDLWRLRLRQRRTQVAPISHKAGTDRVLVLIPTSYSMTQKVGAHGPHLAANEHPWNGRPNERGIRKNGNRCPLAEYPEAEREEAGKMSFTDAHIEGAAWMASRNKK